MSELKSKYFTITEASKKLGVSRQTISRWIADGKLTTEAIGREKLIDKAQINRIRRLNIPKFTRMVNEKIADLIQGKYYSKNDEVKVVGKDFMAIRGGGITEKVEITKFDLDIDKDMNLVINLKEIARIPYKKGNK